MLRLGVSTSDWLPVQMCGTTKLMITESFTNSPQYGLSNVLGSDGFMRNLFLRKFLKEGSRILLIHPRLAMLWNPLAIEKAESSMPRSTCNGYSSCHMHVASAVRSRARLILTYSICRSPAGCLLYDIVPTTLNCDEYPFRFLGNGSSLPHLWLMAKPHLIR